MSVRGVITSSGARVAELDDGLDQLALLLFEDALLLAHVDERLDVAAVVVVVRLVGVRPHLRDVRVAAASRAFGRNLPRRGDERERAVERAVERQQR